MSSAPTRGRQSLPPLSARSGAPISSSSSVGASRPSYGHGYGGQGVAKSVSPLPTSLSLGNLAQMRGSSEDTTTTTANQSASANVNGANAGKGSPATAQQKKKKKKGWRGYAWVLEDNQGNVIEVREDDREPGPEGSVAPAPTQGEVDAGENQISPGPVTKVGMGDADRDELRGSSRTRTASGENKSEMMSRPASAVGSSRDVSAAPPQIDSERPYSTPGPAPALAPMVKKVGPASASASVDIDVDDVVTVTPPDPDIESHDIEIDSEANVPVPASSSDHSKEKRAHKSSSPLSVAPSGSGDQELPQGPVDDVTSEQPSSTAVATPAEPTSHSQPPKKRRKTSPPTTTPSGPSAAPPLERKSSHHKPAKTKTARPSAFGALPTRSQKAFLVREAHSNASRAGSQHVVDDDSPLPMPPRSGMGEGTRDTFKESAVREERSIRNEAKMMIDAAQKHREEQEAKRAERERQEQQEQANSNGHGQGSLGKRPRRAVNYRDADEDASSDDVFRDNNGPSIGQQRPGASSSRQGPATDAAPYKETRSHRRSSTNANPNSFEAQYAQIQNSYRAAAGYREREAANAAATAAERSAAAQAAAIMLVGGVPGLVVPPVMAKTTAQTIVLGQAGPANARPPPRDRLDRDYAAGYVGLTSEMESDANGFVENVRDNLRQILEFYFVTNPRRRDAFCEMIGRGLARLGWELTDNGAAATQPPRRA